MAQPSLNSPNSDDKLYAGLSYAGMVLCSIPAIVIFLLKKDESRHIKFHSLQAIGFWLVAFVISTVANIVFMIVGQIPVLGFIVALIGPAIIMLAFVGYWVYLMIQAFTGKDVQIPYLGDFINQNLMG